MLNTLPNALSCHPLLSDIDKDYKVLNINIVLPPKSFLKLNIISITTPNRLKQIHKSQLSDKVLSQIISVLTKNETVTNPSFSLLDDLLYFNNLLAVPSLDLQQALTITFHNSRIHHFKNGISN
ncbi:hypothetical protein DSO57_1028340 [Entomophthora muscae]|uniref:Uncharacterized protein n=1 Tax=Entomophthora muscae TaxID=34485 RepID=A0ACC2TCG4_9FUNG|nr:hypothetical protein DSO57_1028340 [Entomophthora muscae]